MMVCVFGPLLLSVLLTLITTSLSTSEPGLSARAELAAPCPERWLLFGQRCFAFYPVWSSWSAAESMCSQAGSNLASLHTPEEWQFVHQLTDRHTPVWLGGYQAPQADYWFWSDGSAFRYNDWANQRTGKTREGGACMEMKAESAELNDAPCGELRFYVCTRRVSSGPDVFPGEQKPAEQVRPGLSVFEVLWSRSESVAEEILRSSFVAALRSGRLTQSCYTRFSQQEAQYLHRVSSTLQVLVDGVRQPDDIRALLQETQQHYSNTQQSLLSAPPSLSLRLSLQSFHSVVLDDPIYWLVLLSVRARLRSFLAAELLASPALDPSPAPGTGPAPDPRLVFRPQPPAEPESGTHSLRKRSDPDSDSLSSTRLLSGPPSETSGLLQQWIRESLMEEVWADRYKEVIEKYQDQMDLFKAINVFREHIINQKSLYKAVSCEPEDEEDEGSLRKVKVTGQTI